MRTTRRLISIAFSLLCGITLYAPPQQSGAVFAETGSKLIALTFDDGPNTTTTNEVLDLLEQYDAKATFFLIGDNINSESAVSVKRAFDMGCEIGNHSKTHSNMSSMSAEVIKTEIDFVDAWVEQITGTKTTFFRPPFIDVSQSMYDAIDLPFICGIDCQDYMENVSAEARAAYILNGAVDGTIVLLHDAAGNEKTVEALKIAMPQLAAEGYEFVTLSELFARQGETPKDYILYTYVTKYPCSGYELKRNIYTGKLSGETGAADWQNLSLDPAELAALGSDYAIEVAYYGAYQPVLNLQKWTGAAIWYSVQPAYYNGEHACFLAEDVLSALENLGVTCTDLDRISIAPYSGYMELTQADLLVRGSAETVAGDVNADGECDLVDLVLLNRYLLCDPTAVLKNALAGDLDQSGTLNAVDLTRMKRMLMNR